MQTLVVDPKESGNGTREQKMSISFSASIIGSDYKNNCPLKVLKVRMIRKYNLVLI